MSIEVQSAPKITQIGLGRTDNDLQFCLDESGVISTKRAHSKAENISKNKEPISKDKIQDMASNYSDYYDSYDEDFEDASPERSPRKERERTERRRSSYLSRDYTRSDISVTPPRRTKRNTDSRRNSLTSYRSAYGNSRATNKPLKKKTKKSQSASTRTVKTDEASHMVQRILSANRNKITKLYNTVEELQHEVDNLRQENKTLKRMHVKQEKELKQIEKAEASLPQLLQRHSAELRTYREQLRKTKVDMTKKDKESHNNDLEITKLREKVQYYKSLDNDKKLEERAALTRKLDKVDKALSEKDKRITDLQKTITLAEKGRQREIKEQQERHKKAAEELKNVREQVAFLKDKLKEKEKMLDNTNVYYQSIQKKFKKSNPFALPPVQPEDLHSMKDYESTASHSDKKRTNVFITNGPSDSGSFVAESEVTKRHLGKGESRQKEKEDTVAKRLEFEKLEDTQLGEVLEREERRRKEEEDARKREELLKREQEEEFERMRQMKKRQDEERRRLKEERRREEEERKRQEEEKKRREEERQKEEMMRKMREEERIRKEKEEQQRLKFKEDEETRRKKDLLLARMKAIDAEKSTKPNGIIDVDLGSKSRDEKQKKLPIFLQSSEKPKETPPVLGESHDNEKTKNGSTTSVRSKHSRSSSYDFKETIQNLHHGLPAHPSDQHLRTVAVKSQKDSLGDDGLVFGSYKPSVGKRDTKKSETFGSYNPSFNEPKDTGLDFSKKQERKVSSPPKDNDLVFGSYQPTFGSDVVDGAAQRGGRRGCVGQKSNSIFGDDFLSNDKPKPNKTASLFSEGSSSKSNDKSYPWEKKVNVAKQSVDESLLPRRQKIQQGLNKGHEQNVPAVRNVLNDTIDDDIEEVTL